MSEHDIEDRLKARIWIDFKGIATLASRSVSSIPVCPGFEDAKLEHAALLKGSTSVAVEGNRNIFRRA